MTEPTVVTHEVKSMRLRGLEGEMMSYEVDGNNQIVRASGSTALSADVLAKLWRVAAQFERLDSISRFIDMERSKRGLAPRSQRSYSIAKQVFRKTGSRKVADSVVKALVKASWHRSNALVVSESASSPSASATSSDICLDLYENIDWELSLVEFWSSQFEQGLAAEDYWCTMGGPNYDAFQCDQAWDMINEGAAGVDEHNAILDTLYVVGRNTGCVIQPE